MMQCMGGIAAGGSGVESKFRSPLIASMAKNVFPRPVVGSPGCFRTNSRRMIEQLLYRNAFLAAIAQRFGPWDEVERPVVEFHFLRRKPALALFGRNGQN